MSIDFHEEETLGKAYDHKLLKRLLKYARPYWWMILSSIILLLLITAFELAQPYLIKVAIDDHINGIYKPMVAYELGKAPIKGVIFQDKEYVREKDLKSTPTQLPRYQIIETKNAIYLIQGMIAKDQSYQVQVVHGKPTIISGDKTYPTTELSTEEFQRFRQQDIQSLYRIGGLFFILLLLSFILNYIQIYLLQYTGQKIIFQIRQEIFSHVQSLPLAFFDKNPVGRLVTRVTNDTEALNEMYTSVLVSLFKDFFILIGIMIVMLKMNVKLALLSFVSIPLIILTSFVYKRLARDAFRIVRTRLARINATLNENISGMRIVQIFHREKKQYEQFNVINSSHYQASIKELKTAAIFRPSMDFIYSISLAFLLWFGGKDVIAGVTEFGVLYAFIDYIRRFFQPINDLTEKYTIMQSAMASSERIFQLLDHKDTIPNPTQPKPIGQLMGKIEFDHVWFAYQDEDWVLKDVSFTIQPGEMVAFVGATGAGKSSIINLLGRFYDIQKGSIRIDGIDIRDMDKYELRKQIGIVLQDVFLFAGDIKSNIRLNRKDITDEEIKQVAHYVNADQFIEKLPNQYDEEVKERGSTLSQGQRQLLAFARTLAFNPAILILDEATANIDTATEQLIQDALNKIIHGRTTIVVAHRLSTIQHADKIIVLHKGRIREMGNHQELLSLKGLYYKLYQLQYKEDFQSNHMAM
ncbi:ABC transporter ATP-binding protein [Tepidibacillus fermentans]|uniref:ATP-binding cassette subfamily B protein/subfamily B ATP-binding cassette protein MsbA n=1 Tax=Tepidibacillus fermentans TaxID=1281767 RepID=A0A4R3KI90_9BACI|nr:ABC transporter ATP-binding protein [Tepidibacillus fermentans]TCS83215.1 ATP-binding cassette subfamily B protein/subfamily B ATP-binding cassette protein MsbA [Tepidibacillus fermentans]